MLAAAFAMAKGFSAHPMSQIAPANIRLGAGGSIDAWIVCGPFPNVPDETGLPNGLKTEWIGSEANAAPHEGGFLTYLRDPGIPDFWRLSTTDPRHELDFDTLFNGKTPGVAYAFTSLVSPKPASATLHFDASNFVRVILNGKTVFEGPTSNGTGTPLKVELQEGPNRLLIKTVHTAGQWFSKVTVSGPTPVFEQVGVYPNSEHAEPADKRAIRAVRSKAGALDLAAALSYDGTTRYASQWLDIFYDVAVRPAVLGQVIGEAGRYVVSAQTQDADRISLALARATRLIQVAFELSRIPVVAAAQHPKPLFKTRPRKEDYICIGPGRRFFCHSNGRFFPVIGFTQRLSATAINSANPSNPAYNPEDADAYFAKISNAGVNLVRLSIDSPDVDPLEDSKGAFSPEHLKWIDNLVLLSLKHGVKLLVSAYDDPNLTSVPSIDSQKRRWKFIVDRWGNTGVVFAWELVTRANNANATGTSLKIQALSDYVRKYEIAKWGRSHLLTTSWFWTTPNPPVGKALALSKSLDFDEVMLYVGSSRAPTDAWTSAKDVLAAAQSCLATTRGYSPFLDAENGPIDHPVGDAQSDADVFANTAWAEFVSGSAGVGLRRPYRSPDILTDDMLDTLTSIRRFSNSVDWASLSMPGTSNLVAKAPHRWMTSGFGTAKSAVVWAAGPVVGDQISLADRCPIQKGRVRIYDCMGRHWVADVNFNRTLPIPAGLKSVAYLLSPE